METIITNNESLTKDFKNYFFFEGGGWGEKFKVYRKT